MRLIDVAEKNVFKLVFSKNKTGEIFAVETGKISINKNLILLDYKNNTDTIGWIEESCVIIRTLHKNLLPLYVRIEHNEVWISNDVSELLIYDEEVSIRLIEVIDAAAGSKGNRTAFSHLIEEITLLMPSSLYRISFENTSPSIEWSDCYFEFVENATKEEYLDLLIEQYRKTYSEVTDICLALSGGYDSRLELAILTHLKKNVHCFHYISSKHEEELTRSVAHTAGASFHEVDYEQLISPGWDFIKRQGYLTRWDGFFAPGVISAAGLYLQMEKEYPGEVKSIMGTETRLNYSHLTMLPDYWLQQEEQRYNKCCMSFPQYSSLLKQEKERRQEIISRVISSIQSKYDRDAIEREDIVTDIFNTMLGMNGKHATRSTFLFENGAPFFTSRKTLWEFIISSPQKDKEGEKFLKWAIGTLNPKINKIPYYSQSSRRSTSRLRSLIHTSVVGKLFLGKFINKKIGDCQEWLRDKDVLEIFKQFPEIKEISKNAKDGKSELEIAQICRFLKVVQEKKKVTFRIVK